MNESYSFYTEKLNGEYRTVFSKIELYVTTKYIDGVTKEEQLSELLDIFLTAQSEGKPIHKITGNNLERFCKTFCSGYGVKNRLLDFLDVLKNITLWLFVVAAVDMLFIALDYFDGTQVDLWTSNSSINIPAYLIGIAISLLIGLASNLIVRHIMFCTKRISMTVLQVIDFFVVIGAMILILIFILTNSDTLCNCPDWVIMLICAVYLIPYYLFNYKRLREKKRNKVRFKDMVARESENQIPSLMEWKFQKANKRNIKKGKGELSMADFLKKEEKDCRITEKSKWFYILLPIVVIVPAYLAEYVSGGFESAADSIVFICVMLIIEYAIMFGLWKIAKSGAKDRRAWIEKKWAELESETDDFLNETEETDE